MIDNKHAAVDHPLDQRDKKDMLQLVALCFGSAIGLAYCYGWFNPKNYLTSILTPEKFTEDCLLPCQSDNIQKSLEPCPESETSQK
ncbi:unnamed protein product [Parnassius apollo]|uniref:(apollo) hypothetical protein n=1 Tax=Parnassius apollo TaxID=110799 RepID=A0A8S3XB48_PARAO|nr:unnamed protein product [Parnassius apollo]